MILLHTMVYATPIIDGYKTKVEWHFVLLILPKDLGIHYYFETTTQKSIFWN